MSSSKDNGGDPDISRIFSQKVDRRFQRDFGRLIHHQPANRTAANNEQHQNEPSRGQEDQQQRRIGSNNDNHLTVKLVEAKEEITKLQRQLNSRNEEVENMKADLITANEKVAELQKELNEMKLEREKDRRASKHFSENNANKTENKLLLDDYRTALMKYKTWMQFANKQMLTMKMLLEEVGGWNEMNRYKIYFAYRTIQPETVTDDKIPELASGSVIDYPGAIEEIEGITSTQIRPKFHCAHTQTEESIQPPSLTSPDQSPYPQHSHSLMNTSFVEAQPSAGDQMSAQELRLIDCEQQIERIEFQNAQMREQLIILSDRAKNVELLEEQKQDLQMQMDILRRQNAELIREHEQLKTAFGGGSITRNALEELIRSAEQLKAEKQGLEQKLRELEGQKEGITLAESRRIGQIFKQKYETEMAELRAKLQKYEPMHQSDTTRIYRFAQHNPLDEAHDEHLVKKAAAGVGNPLKRRKMDDDNLGETSTATPASELTFLAGEDEEGGPDPDQLRELRLQLANVKEHLEKSERAHTDYANQYRELVSQLCGYEIRLGEDGFCEAENVLSRDCTFLFRKHQQGEEQQQSTAEGVDLLESESTRKWKDVVDNYLLRYNSVPAFLSAITISIVESPETPLSTHSSISIVEDEETAENGDSTYQQREE